MVKGKIALTDPSFANIKIIQTVEKKDKSLVFRLAWRDSRRQRGRLLLFVSSIIVGIAALVAINSFSENLQKDINSQAKDLLGADLVVSGVTAPSAPVQRLLDSLPGTRTTLISFLSMAYFPQSEGTRPVNVKAVRGQYPFYGQLVTEPANAYDLLKDAPKALVDNSLALQFNLKTGDSVRVGDRSYLIVGKVLSAPGRSGVQSSIAPSVFLPLAALDSANLLQRGSRVEYNYLFLAQNKTNNWGEKGFKEAVEKVLKPEKYSVETLEDRKASTGDAFGQLTDFLNLVGFIALLLGCIGVASAVNIYIKDKKPTIAILRTLGASGRQAFLVYGLQITAMGLVGAVIGAVIGISIQGVLPLVLKDFLPIDNVSTTPSLSAVGLGIGTGLSIAVLFALLPLLNIRHTSPLATLRQSVDQTPRRDPLRGVVYVLIGLFIFGFTYYQTQSVRSSIAFIVGVGVALGALAGAARLLMWSVKRFFPKNGRFALRQSIANLYRPNNQTLTLMVSIGLGTMLISTLLLTQELLLTQISFAGSGNQPNMILFDIQPSQKDSVGALVEQHKMPILQRVPIVTIRLESLNNVSRQDFLKDTVEKDIPRWVYDREYRVTFRDSLIDSETLLEGQLPAPGRAADGTVGVTISDNLAKNMQATVGTPITFNVQGALVKTVVTGIRKVDFARVQTNFLVLFPSGVLEKAPQFNVVITKVQSAEQSAAFQNALVQRFPNISVVDLTQILKTVDAVLSKVSFVIRFMALFSILTGLTVLVSSVFLSKYQRIRESVLLRTMGASKVTILRINGLEYLWLGLLSTLSGVLLAVLATWALAQFSFKIPFSINFYALSLPPLSITALIVAIGLFNSRKVVSESPLEILRQDVSS